MPVHISLITDGSQNPTVELVDSPTHDGSRAVLRFGDTIIAYESSKSPGSAGYDFADFLCYIAADIRDAAYTHTSHNLAQMVLGGDV